MPTLSTILLVLLTIYRKLHVHHNILQGIVVILAVVGTEVGDAEK